MRKRGRRAAMITVYKFFRAVGMFVGNLVTAIIGTAVVVSELYHETILGALVTFALGYLVYYKWRPTSSKWVFVAGLPGLDGER